jgi:exopolysaccharide biosynthesis WecB/TagA/CpsF family protein
VKPVFAAHGFQDENSWGSVLRQLRESKPEILILGLGSPRELIFAHQRLSALPPCLVLTSGGWFGFLTSEEQRASLWAQKLGLEWAYRMLADPRRLTSRYAIGLFNTAKYGARAIATRALTKRPSRWFGKRRSSQATPHS